MTRAFKILRNKMSSTARKKSTKKMQRLVAEMPLQELRQARELSQEKLAKLLDTKQANISRLEQRTDMYISTLRAYIEAMGGTLEIIAHFPNGDVRVNQFREI